MKYTSFLFLLACLSLSSCSSNNENDDLILYNESNTVIELVDIEDSRCPLDVTCVWEGDANVFLKITSNDSTALFNLHTNPNMDDHVKMIQLFKHEIILNDVLPYPSSIENNWTLEEYQVDLTVTRL